MSTYLFHQQLPAQPFAQCGCGRRLGSLLAPLLLCAGQFCCHKCRNAAVLGVQLELLLPLPLGLLVEHLGNVVAQALLLLALFQQLLDALLIELGGDAIDFALLVHELGVHALLPGALLVDLGEQVAPELLLVGLVGLAFELGVVGVALSLQELGLVAALVVQLGRGGIQM